MEEQQLTPLEQGVTLQSLVTKQIELLHTKSNEEDLTPEQLAMLSSAFADVVRCYRELF